jgi:hypothetical protein
MFVVLLLFSSVLANLTVFEGRFPLTASFRNGPRNEVKDYQMWSERQAKVGKHFVDLTSNVLRFTPQNFEFANRFAQEHPSTLMISTWRASSGLPVGTTTKGDPLGMSTISFPGHFVQSPGTKLLSSISSSATTITVQDNGMLIRGPAILVEKSGQNFDWSKFEYIFVSAASGNTATITRKFSAPSPDARSFPANSHVANLPWDDRNTDLWVDWFFNLSPDCPKDANGRSAMDIVVSEMAKPLSSGGPLSNIGGLDLASGPLTVDPTNADYNLDGVADSSAPYRQGVQTFYQRLRETIGKDAVIITSLDPNNKQYINGYNLEGLANPNDAWIDVSRTVNEVLSWQRIANLPMVSLAFVQHLKKDEEPLWIQMRRLLNGYAVCLGMTSEVELEEEWHAAANIELFKGDANEAHWLGKPTGRVKRVAKMLPNLLHVDRRTRGNDFSKIIPSLGDNSGKSDNVVENNQLVLKPSAKMKTGELTLELRFVLSKPGDFTVFYEAMSGGDEVERRVLEPRMNIRCQTTGVRAVLSGKAYYPLSFLFRDCPAGEVQMRIRFEGRNDVRFKSLSVHAATDVLACHFENGVVLVNPSLRPVTLNLKKVFRRRTSYERIKATRPQNVNVPPVYSATVQQAYDINNGETVPRWNGSFKATVGGRDSLFLISKAPVSSNFDNEADPGDEDGNPFESEEDSANFPKETPPALNSAPVHGVDVLFFVTVSAVTMTIWF